jgi:predicted DsbA family dithiol-disulfide isomerase
MAHTLVKYCEGKPQQDALMNVIFRHYFTDGKYPDAANLREAAAEVGLEDLDAATAFMEGKTNQDEVRKEALDFSRQGVSGVPYFFFNNQPAFSGAQPPAALKQTILQAADATK